MKKNNKNWKNGDRLIKDIPRFENDLYRVSAWTGKEGLFLKLQVHFRGKEDGNLIPTEDEFSLRAQYRGQVADALVMAKNGAELPAPQGDEKFTSRVVLTIPIGDGKFYEVNKIRGTKNRYVGLRYCRQSEDGERILHSDRGISILESSVDGVVEALRSQEAEPAQAEEATQAA